MPDSIRNQDDWIEVRDIGNVKAIKTLNAPHKYGYFKRADKIQGPGVANEYLASKLAKLLGIPTALIQIHTLGGVNGYISHAHEYAESWSAFPDKPTAREHLSDPAVFSKIFVFDYWIRHVDRHDGNLAFVKNGESGTYDVYLIDNEHCMCGVGDNAPNENELEDFPDVFRMQNHTDLINKTEVYEFIEHVLNVDKNAIVKLIDEFLLECPEHFDENKAEYIKKFILVRKDKLREEIDKLYQSGRIK